MIEASVIGVQIMMLRNTGRKIPRSMEVAYHFANAEVKAQLKRHFNLEQEIANLIWDTDEYLTPEQTRLLTTPLG